MGSVFTDTRFKSTTKKRYRPKTVGGIIKHPKRTEENLQIKICNYLRSEYPHVPFCSDYAAGLDLTDNQRQKMMAMRSHDGQPDISIDFASRGYHGLRIELKKEGTIIYKKDGSLRKQSYTRRYWKRGKLIIKRGDHLQEQEYMLKKYNDGGYFARFCIGEAKAIQLINWYMEKKQNMELF